MYLKAKGLRKTKKFRDTINPLKKNFFKGHPLLNS